MPEQETISGRINILRHALTSDKNKVAFILGAGCPFSIKDKEEQPLINNISGLTKSVCDKLTESTLLKLKKGILLPKSKEPTVEDLLSRIRLLIEIIGESEFDGLKIKDLIQMEKSICELITQEVNKELPKNDNPYNNFTAWVAGISRKHPVEIFTPNYDLLIESALETKNIPYFDGFIGSRKAFFDLHSIEHDKLPARWVRLWKLHGSINWWLEANNNNVFRGNSINTENEKQMIYPSHLKYAQSRRMPYLAMQDKLASFLSTGQSVLITCGYSFVDQHLNEIITQRLSANPRSVCFGLLYGKIEEYPEAVDCAKKSTNLHLISLDKAFFAGEEKIWSNEDPLAQYNYLKYDDNGDTFCKIGDFNSFTEFLLKQTGEYNLEE